MTMRNIRRKTVYDRANEATHKISVSQINSMLYKADYVLCCSDCGLVYEGDDIVLSSRATLNTNREKLCPNKKWYWLTPCLNELAYFHKESLSDEYVLQDSVR